MPGYRAAPALLLSVYMTANMLLRWCYVTGPELFCFWIESKDRTSICIEKRLADANGSPSSSKPT
jgi:hypothetical protein